MNDIGIIIGTHLIILRLDKIEYTSPNHSIMPFRIKYGNLKEYQSEKEDLGFDDTPKCDSSWSIWTNKSR